MFISASTFDDLLRKVFERLLASKTATTSNKKGATVELTGVLLRLTRPRFRLSRTETRATFFSALGELLWYLSGKNDLKFITYYTPKYAKYSDGKGGYGPRLFSMRKRINQIDNVLRLLKSRQESRQAVIQLFDADDLVQKTSEDIPCTCTLQFLVRRHGLQWRLHMMTHMRSNDAYMGLPHDLFAFTMLQEIFARSLNVELGSYFHSVGSLHLYERNRDDAKAYLGEGHQTTDALLASMPTMPIGDPWPSIEKIRHIERAIRTGKQIPSYHLDPYWGDIANALHAHALLRKKGKLTKAEHSQLRKIKARFHSPFYNYSISTRQRRRKDKPQQLRFARI